VRLILAAFAFTVIAGCTGRGVTRVVPDPVVHETEATPKVMRVDRKLTEQWRTPIPEGPLAMCPIIAAERSALLKAAYGALRQIEERHGGTD
jgi:hypothetical protein